ncbi:MAG: preprotein translocase subunit SecE [Bacteroidetes bacterium]|nr:preprotein translocase subunit SecE [Bacteroidota bacterium]
MNKIVLYVEEAYDELVHKVSWPTWAELQQSAIVVLVAAVILALLILSMDLVSQYGSMFIYTLIHGKPPVQ